MSQFCFIYVLVCLFYNVKKNRWCIIYDISVLQSAPSVALGEACDRLNIWGPRGAPAIGVRSCDPIHRVSNREGDAAQP